MKTTLRVFNGNGSLIETKEIDVPDEVGTLLFGPDGPGPDDAVTMVFNESDDAE